MINTDTDKLRKIEPAMFAGGNIGKKPSHDQIATRIQQIMKDFGQYPQSINSGDCERFAETPLGVTHWWELPV